MECGGKTRNLKRVNFVRFVRKNDNNNNDNNEKFIINFFSYSQKLELKKLFTIYIYFILFYFLFFHNYDKNFNIFLTSLKKKFKKTLFISKIK